MEFSIEIALDQATQLSIAFLLAIFIGWHREMGERSAGLRTFPIVALASCAYILLGRYVFQGAEDAEARMLQGLMTGIGFIGGGAIIKTEKGADGTATAASIWSVGAIGAACAYRRYDFAIVIAATNMFILLTLSWVKAIFRKNENLLGIKTS